MIIWIIFAVITGVVTAVLLHPLSTPGRALAPPESGAGRIYREQIAELLRERSDGRITGDEYELARAETARRLFREADAGADERKCRPASLGKVKLAVAGFLSVASISLYIVVGSPDLPSLPLQQRLSRPGQDLAILIRKTEAHLEKAPDDGRGWDVIAPIYLRTNRAADAARAYENAIRVQGPSADRFDGLTEALLASSNGMVTEQIKSVLERSLRSDPGNPRAAFYSALGLEQAGETERAKAAFEVIAKESPADAPWLPMVNDHIAKNGGTPDIAAGKAPGGPTAEDVVAPQLMNSGDQQQMIRGMVESLDAKLRADPNNLEGWVRLVRSYAVLNDKDRAADALKRGLTAFPADGDEGKQLIALGRELGVAAEGMTE